MDDLRLTSLNLPGIDENKRPLVIAGPCSAETEEQVMATARQLAEKGFKIFRAGVWKPRTKPGGFEGMGETALPWLQRVKEETGMLIATEVAMPKHVEASLKAGVDLLWVGARTTANPFAMQELADSLKGVDIPVLVKNPVNPDIELWIGALQRINGGRHHPFGGPIHRGFSSIDQKIYRNAPMWHIPIELHRRTGISTCCPSATTLVLALGPDLPRADQLYSGNLGYSVIRILTLFSLLIPAFSLPCSPQLLSVLLLPACNAPLPNLSVP